jgi:ankyrin repeat protein
MNIQFLWRKPAWALLLLYQGNFLAMPLVGAALALSHYDLVGPVIGAMANFIVFAAPVVFYLGWIRREATVTWIAGTVLICGLPMVASSCFEMVSLFRALACAAGVIGLLLGFVLYICSMTSLVPLIRTAMKEEVTVLGCGAGEHDDKQAGAGRLEASIKQRKLVRNWTLAALCPWLMMGLYGGSQWLWYELATPAKVKLNTQFAKVLVEDYVPQQVTGFVDAGADVDTKGEYGTALSLACQKSDEPLIGYLLTHHADPNGPSNLLSTVIGHSDCTCGSSKLKPEPERERIAFKMLSHGARIDDGHSKRALVDAISQNYSPDLIEALIAAGADISAWQDDSNGTPLIAAISAHRENVVNQLLQHGAEVNRVVLNTNRPATAIHAAAHEKDLAALHRMIAAGANVNTKDGHGRTPLSYAQERHDTNIAQALLRAGAK